MEKEDNHVCSHIDFLLERYPRLTGIKEEIIQGYFLLEQTFYKDSKLLIAGNGGSAADAEHMVGELMKGFRLSRKPDKAFMRELIQADEVLGKQLAEKLQGALPAMALTSHNALNSAFLNDVDGLSCYAQQVYGYGKPDDLFLGISTSGNSKNILYAAVAAKAKGMKVLGLTGNSGGRLQEFCDVCVAVPEKETYLVQEYHLPVYHCWCLMLEERFFGEKMDADIIKV